MVQMIICDLANDKPLGSVYIRDIDRHHNKNMNTIKLNNGVEMPQIGYGVYQVSPNEYERCISSAL